MCLKLKDEQFLTFHVTNSNKMTILQQNVRTIDQSIDPSETKKESAKKNDALQKFYDEHCVSCRLCLALQSAKCLHVRSASPLI